MCDCTEAYTFFVTNKQRIFMWIVEWVRLVPAIVLAEVIFYQGKITRKPVDLKGADKTVAKYNHFRFDIMKKVSIKNHRQNGGNFGGKEIEVKILILANSFLVEFSWSQS